MLVHGMYFNSCCPSFFFLVTPYPSLDWGSLWDKLCDAPSFSLFPYEKIGRFRCTLFQLIRIYIFNSLDGKRLFIILKMETSTYLGACLKVFFFFLTFQSAPKLLINAEL
jgi:hypothetical protein